MFYLAWFLTSKVKQPSPLPSGIYCIMSSPWVFPQVFSLLFFIFNATQLLFVIIHHWYKLLQEVVVLGLFLSDIRVDELHHASAPILKSKIHLHLSERYMFSCPQPLTDEEIGHYMSMRTLWQNCRFICIYASPDFIDPEVSLFDPNRISL